MEHKDNVTPLKVELTLDSVRKALNAWRSAKKTQSEKIPLALWNHIFTLLIKHTEAEVRSALFLTRTQLERGRKLVRTSNILNETSASPQVEPLDFCEARQDITTRAAVTPLFDAKKESNISEEDWFAKEILEEEHYQAAKNKNPTTPLVYKPAEAFSTATSVVEIRRPDGMLMSIHICTDRFEELLRAFFKG